MNRNAYICVKCVSESMGQQKESHGWKDDDDDKYDKRRTTRINQYIYWPRIDTRSGAFNATFTPPAATVTGLGLIFCPGVNRRSYPRCWLSKWWRTREKSPRVLRPSQKSSPSLWLWQQDRLERCAMPVSLVFHFSAPSPPLIQFLSRKEVDQSTGLHTN